MSKDGTKPDMMSLGIEHFRLWGVKQTLLNKLVKEIKRQTATALTTTSELDRADTFLLLQRDATLESFI